MIYSCPGCGARFRSDVAGVVECPACGAKARVEPAVEDGAAWDRAGRGKWVGAFVDTVKDSLVSPVDFFEGVSRGSGWVRPWVYALVTSCVVFIFAAAYQAGFQALALSLDITGEIKKALIPLAAITIPVSAWALIALCALVVPLFTTFVLLLQSAVYHACLLVLGEARGDFLKTFRVVCYASGPQLFQVVPLLGGAVGPIWQLALLIIGVKVAHKTSYGKGALAIFLPTIICCGLLLVAAAAVLGGVLGAAVVGNR